MAFYEITAAAIPTLLVAIILSRPVRSGAPVSGPIKSPMASGATRMRLLAATTITIGEALCLLALRGHVIPVLTYGFTWLAVGMEAFAMLGAVFLDRQPSNAPGLALLRILLTRSRSGVEEHNRGKTAAP